LAKDQKKRATDQEKTLDLYHPPLPRFSSLKQVVSLVATRGILRFRQHSGTEAFAGLHYRKDDPGELVSERHRDQPCRPRRSWPAFDVRLDVDRRDQPHAVTHRQKFARPIPPSGSGGTKRSPPCRQGRGFAGKELTHPLMAELTRPRRSVFARQRVDLKIVLGPRSTPF
jgi:hypothetical protein